MSILFILPNLCLFLFIRNAHRLIPLFFRYRHVQNDFTSRPLSKGILDGPLLSSFLSLPISKQKALVEPLGTDRETLGNDLWDLERGGGAGGGWVW